jgi:hypothetical protein
MKKLTIIIILLASILACNKNEEEFNPKTIPQISVVYPTGFETFFLS